MIFMLGGKMYYYLYEIKNLLNDKIYIGVHKTKNLNDGYMGSGRLLLKDIEVYGIENFQKTILEFFESEFDMFQKEKRTVDKSFLSRDDVYNLRCGGYGGFDWINQSGIPKFKGRRHTEESKLKMSLKSKEQDNSRLGEIMKKIWSDKSDEERQNFGKMMSARLTGRKLSREHRENLSKSLKSLDKQTENLSEEERETILEKRRESMAKARSMKPPMTDEQRQRHSEIMKESHRRRREAKAQKLADLQNIEIIENNTGDNL